MRNASSVCWEKARPLVLKKTEQISLEPLKKTITFSKCHINYLTSLHNFYFRLFLLNKPRRAEISSKARIIFFIFLIYIFIFYFVKPWAIFFRLTAIFFYGRCLRPTVAIAFYFNFSTFYALGIDPNVVKVQWTKSLLRHCDII